MTDLFERGDEKPMVYTENEEPLFARNTAKADLVTGIFSEGAPHDEDDFEMPTELDGVTAETVDPMQLHTLLSRYSQEQRNRIVRELVRRVDAA